MELAPGMQMKFLVTENAVQCGLSLHLMCEGKGPSGPWTYGFEVEFLELQCSHWRGLFRPGNLLLTSTLLLGSRTFIVLCAPCWPEGGWAGLRPLLPSTALRPRAGLLSRWQYSGNTQQGHVRHISVHTSHSCSGALSPRACWPSSSNGEQDLMLSLEARTLALTYQVCLCPELLHSHGL